MKKLFLLLAVGLTVCGSIQAQENPFAAWEHDPEWNALTNHLTACYEGIVERCEALRYHEIYYGRERIRDVVAPPEPPTFIWPVYDYIRFAEKLDELAPHYIRHDLQDADGSLNTYFSTGAVDVAMWDALSLHECAGFANWSTNMLLHSWALADRSIQNEVASALNLLKWTKARNQSWIAGADGELSGNHGVSTANVRFIEGIRTYGYAQNANLTTAISEAVDNAVSYAITNGNPNMLMRGSLVVSNSYYGEYCAELEIIDAKMHIDNLNTGITTIAVTVVGYAGDNDFNQKTGWRFYGTILDSASIEAASEYTFTQTVLGDLGTSVDDLYWGPARSSYYVAGDWVMLPVWDLHLYYQWEPDPLCTELHWNLINPRMYWESDWRNADVGLMAAHARDGIPPKMFSVGSDVGQAVQFHSAQSRMQVEHLSTNTAYEVDYYAMARKCTNSVHWSEYWPELIQNIPRSEGTYHAVFDDCGTEMPEDKMYRFDASSLATSSNAVSRTLGRKERAPLWEEWCSCPPYAYTSHIMTRGFVVDAQLAVIKWDFPEVSEHEQVSMDMSPDFDRDGLLDIGAVPDDLSQRTGFVVMDPEADGPIVYIPLVVTPAWYRGLRVNTFWCQGAFAELPYYYLSRNKESTYYYLPYCYDNDGPYQAFSLNTRIIESAFVSNEERNEKRVSLLRPHGTLVEFDFAWDASASRFETKGYPVGVNSNRTYILKDLTPDDHLDFNYELMFESGISHIYGAEKYDWFGGELWGKGWLKKVIHRGVAGLRWADADGFMDEEYMPEISPGGKVNWVEEFFVPANASDTRFSTDWSWDEGLITKFTLTSKKDSSSKIEVTPSYDAQGRLIGLSKTGVAGIEQSNFNIAPMSGGGRVDYPWGSVSLAGDAPPGSARNVTLTRLVNGVSGSVQESYSFDDKDRLQAQSVAANGQTVQTRFEYYQDPGRYDNGALKSSRLKTITRFDGGQSFFEYATDTGWLVKESSPVGNGTTKSTRYSYSSAETAGDEADVSLFIERPRKIEAYIDDACISRRLFAYNGLAQTTMELCASNTSSWGSSGNLKFVDKFDVAEGSWDMLRIGLPVSSSNAVDSTAYLCSISGNDLQVRADRSDGKSFTSKQNPLGVEIYRDVIENAVATAKSQLSTDALHRPARATDLMDGTYTEYSNYNLFGPQTVRDVDGSLSTIEYYAHGPVRRRVDGVTGIATEFQYDLPGNVVEAKTIGTGGELVIEQAAFDALGRQVYSKDSVGGETTTQYSLISGGGSRSVTTLPGGGVVQKDSFYDGSLREVSGTGTAAHIRKKYGIKDAVYCEASILVGDAGEETAWTEAYYNMLGQVYKTRRPSDAGSVVESVNLFDSKARAVGSIDENNITTLRHFNQKNEISDAGLHVDGQVGQLTPASSDRYSSFNRNVSPEGVMNQTLVRPIDGSGSSEILSQSERAFDGKSWWSTYAGRTSTGERSAYEPGGRYEVVSQSSDGRKTISKYEKWRLARSESYDRNSKLIEFEQRSYNGLGALRQTSHIREGITTYQYDSLHRLSAIIPADLSKGMTLISYKPGTRLKSSVAGPDGKQVFYDYWPNGLLKRESGAGDNLYFEYDSQGRKRRMTTWRNGNPVITEWKYNRYTGQPEEKWIAGQKVESYKYRANGQAEAVTDAEGIASLFNYGPAGDLKEVVTSDGSSRTVNTVDRMGQVVAVAEEGGISESCVRLLDGLVAGVTVQGNGIVSNSNLSYVRGADDGEIRWIDWQVEGGVSGRVDIARDAFMRVTNVAMGGISAEYTYPTNGSMVTGVSIKKDGREVMSRSTGWDYTNSRINSIEYKAAAETVAGFYYSFEDNSDRISRIARDDQSYWEYAYDQTNRLVRGTLNGAAGVPVPGMSFGYEYDEIGNITAGGLIGSDSRPWHSFENNDRNAHIIRRWANKVAVRGAANTNVLVAVNMVQADRAGEDFFAAVPVERRGFAAWTNLTVMGIGRNDSGDIVAVETGRMYIASADEAVEYRDTGWRRKDSKFDYEWDRKGRLIAAVSEGQGVKLEFSYYPDGRRAVKKVYQKAAVGQWVLERKHEYYYDEWNVIAELQVSGLSDQVSVTNVTRYMWSLDLNGQRTGRWGQEAGGIGGLLAIEQITGSQTNTYLTISDHQGNIHKVISADTGAVVEEYTYSPFGELLSCNLQPATCINLPFLYQSKYYDPETELYYYGYRYYDPASGKWLSPDPIQEGDGPNLFAFCNNDPVNGVDARGLYLVAFDGTGNNKDAKGNSPTNVERLWKSYQGRAKYIRGVGSSETPGWSIFEKPSGGLTGLGGSARLEEAWTAVVEHYKGMTDAEIAADPLDIIGFSRGAALARAFANLVMERLDPRKFSYMFGVKNGSVTSEVLMSGKPLPIRFVGLYDTVPSFGKPGNHIDLGYNFRIPQSVANVRHAVSRDENRDLFPLLNIWTSSTRLEKMFPGVHSDVGAGYPGAGVLDIQLGPLKWMWEEGVKCGVPWDMPSELVGWTQPAGMLKGHQSNVPALKKFLWVIPYGMAEHPVVEWAPVLSTDKQLRPVWLP